MSDIGDEHFKLFGGMLVRPLAKSVRHYDELVRTKVLPLFPLMADPWERMERRWQQLQALGAPIDEPAAKYGVDDESETFFLEQLVEYRTLTELRNQLLPLFTVGLHHLFERQAQGLCSQWIGGSDKSVKELQRWLKEGQKVDISTAPTWMRVDELRLVANVLKHGEGVSATELRARNPRYFRMTGDDERFVRRDEEIICVSDRDYEQFVSAVIGLWVWLESALDRKAEGMPPSGPDHTR